MHRDCIRQVPGIGARLAVAVMADAVFETDALNAAGEIDGPGAGIDLVAADPLDRGALVGSELLVPAELLQNRHGEFGIAVAKFRDARMGVFREQRLTVVPAPDTC